jgi:predicted aspartyl protease
MGLIYKKISIEGNRGKTLIDALFDSGASVSFIRKDVAERIADLLPLPSPRRFSLGDGKGALEVREVTHVDFHLEEGTIFDEVMVASELAEELVIGAATLQKWRVKLDFEHDEVILDKRLLNLKLI